MVNYIESIKDKNLQFMQKNQYIVLEYCFIGINIT